jgi:hypothetical protein
LGEERLKATADKLVASVSTSELFKMPNGDRVDHRQVDRAWKSLKVRTLPTLLIPPWHCAQRSR